MLIGFSSLKVWLVFLYAFWFGYSWLQTLSVRIVASCELQLKRATGLEIKTRQIIILKIFISTKMILLPDNHINVSLFGARKKSKP